MKPGDLIEWTYRYNDKVVANEEFIWSSIEDRFVQIGGRGIILIAIDDETITWLHPRGCFRSRRDDTRCSSARCQKRPGASVRASA